MSFAVNVSYNKVVIIFIYQLLINKNQISILQNINLSTIQYYKYNIIIVPYVSGTVSIPYQT